MARRSALSLWICLVLAPLLVGGAFASAGPVDAGAVSAAALGAPRTADGRIGLIVRLSAPPVVRYGGGVPGLAATRRPAGAGKWDRNARAVRDYRAHLAREHTAFERLLRAVVPRAEVVHRYDMVVGGVAVVAPESAIETIAALPGVVGIYVDRENAPATNKSPSFVGAKKLWGQLGGPTSAGEGVIVGVLDSGVWPEHPGFADPDPKGNAYPAPPGTYACTFSGGSNPGAPFTCNNKLIGAHRFLDAFETFNPLPPGAFTSARDDDGHGTHTATTAAGNGKVKAELFGRKIGTTFGVAPRAHVIAYRVCGPSLSGGCLNSDAVAAVNQAILDGVDVINYSIGGGDAPYVHPVSQAFLDAYEAGVFVAASAGNTGPDADTVGHLEPWVVTVGASTDKGGLGGKAKVVAADGDKLKLKGASVTPAVKPAVPVLLGADFSDAKCLSSTPDGAFAGSIVVCERGDIARVAKSFNVAERGGVGMILYDAPTGAQGPAPDNHFVPTIHVDATAGTELVDFVTSHSGITASFSNGKSTGLDADVMGGFSSRGGPGNTLGVLKPDVTAPGVQVLAGMTPEPWDPAKGAPGELFQAIQGTSMSSPHVAGAAALLRDLHASWTPGQIRSALMTSARIAKVYKEDGVTPADPFDFGAGRIDLKRAADPGLTLDATAQDFRDHETDLWNVNLPSVLLPATAPDVVTVPRLFQSELAEESTWSVTVDAPPVLGVTVPTEITVPAGGTQSLTIGLDKSALGPGEVQHAWLLLEYKKYDVRLPISAVGTSILPDLTIAAATTSSPATIGGTVTISATVSNATAVGTGRFLVRFYLSDDATFSSDDAAFAFCDAPGGWPASTTALLCSGSITFLPSPTVPSGTYFLLVVVDANGEVSEADEANNVTPAGTVFVS